MTLYQKIVDINKKLECDAGAGADCVAMSILLYLKLEKIGVRRMRGKRKIEQRLGGLHYWVENDTLVYEEHGGVRQIYKKADFYKIHSITDAEQSDTNLFFRDELGYDKYMNAIVCKLRKNDPEVLPLRLELVKAFIAKNA